MKKGVIVLLGGNSSSLLLLRAFARKGWQVVMVTDAHEFGSRSRYGEKYIVTPENPFMKVMADITAKHGRGLKAFATDEHYLNQALIHHPEILDMFDFVMADPGTMRTFLRKTEVYVLCAELGIPVPRIFEAEKVLAEPVSGVFPLAAKRNFFNHYVKETGIPKLVKIENIRDLKAYLEIYGQKPDAIVLQKWLDESFAPVSMGGFYLHGKEQCSIVVEQKRQYPKGVSCFVEEALPCLWEERVRNHTLKLVREARYTGFLEVEYRTNGEEVWLLDVNPRPWKWSKILSAKFNGFPEDILEGEQLKSNRKRVKWADPLKDLTGLKSSRTFRKVFRLRDYSFNMSIYMFDINDFGPFSYLFHR